MHVSCSYGSEHHPVSNLSHLLYAQVSSFPYCCVLCIPGFWLAGVLNNQSLVCSAWGSEPCFYFQGKYVYVDGDGSVPVESAKVWYFCCSRLLFGRKALLRKLCEMFFPSFCRRMGLMQWQELGLQLTTEESSAATTYSGLSSTGCMLENLIRSTIPWTTMSYSQQPMRSRSIMRNVGISHQFQRTGRSSPRATAKPWGQLS